MLVIDKNHAAGGQWLTAYPFVKLHLPSTTYGVNSTPLEPVVNERHDTDHQASRDEILAYFNGLVKTWTAEYGPTGSVKPNRFEFKPMHELRD